jgi:hypothetical protein
MVDVGFADSHAGVSGSGAERLPDLARFELRQRLGNGGMGVVYEAIDRATGARVALKTLHTSESRTLLRLKNEFRLLQDIQHPNLVTLGELVRDGETWFFTMELIDGVDLVTYVAGHRGSADRNRAITAADRQSARREVAPTESRIGWTFDERKLRDACTQLASALQAVHAAGKVHRDVKPSNVLVAPDGRVVLLDFGLVLDAARPTSDEGIVGTVGYMAPEQAVGDPVGPAADWYSLGAVLYECLSGRPPFDGPRREVVQRKLTLDPPNPNDVASGVPADLASLCVELLDRDAAHRPKGEEVVRRLGGRAQMSKPAPPIVRTEFVGRAAELVALHEAYDRVRHGETVVLVVEGQSGVGKSALLHRFFEEISAADPQALVLPGRCYERETVPYKAFDAVMDALSGASPADLMSPVHGALLAQAFPALRNLACLANATLAGNAFVRSRGLLAAAVRGLFAQVGKVRHLVVLIEDLHWSDPDGLALLADVLSPGLAPRMLLLATTRPHGRHGVLPDAQRLELGRLPDEDTMELARRLLGANARPDLATAIARESSGHPLFVDALARHARDLDDREPAPIDLDEVLAARIRRLPDPERKVLEVLCVAGCALSAAVTQRATGLDLDVFARAAAVLRGAHLTRTVETSGSDTVEAYHSRIREAVIRRLPDALRRDCNGRLAAALEAQPKPDPDALTTHWLEAGRPDRAARHARSAADEAFHALAFDRAARLYARAMELVDVPADKQAIRLSLAEALANAGRSGEAARAFLDAAKGAEGHAALDCQRRAGEEFLVAGELEQGLATLGEVLAKVGVPLPRSRAGLLWARTAARAALRVRGLNYTLRDEKAIPREDIIRIDACSAIARGLNIIDPLMCNHFSTQMLLFALRCGEPGRLSYAIGLEAGYLASIGVRMTERSDALIDLGFEIGRRVDPKLADATSCAFRGYARVMQGRPLEALPLCDRASAYLEQVPGNYWSLRSTRLAAMWALASAGSLDELSKRLSHGIREGTERGDVVWTTALRSGAGFAIVALRDGDVESVRAGADDALRQWAHRPYQVQHWWASSALTQVDLYEGKGRAAYDRSCRDFDLARRAWIFRTEGIHTEARNLRWRAAVMAASQSTGRERKRALAMARADSSWLKAAPPHFAKTSGQLADACIAAVCGDRDGGARTLEETLDELLMAPLVVAATRIQIGLRRGGKQGEALAEEGRSYFRDQGVREPDRLMGVILPGW